MEFLHSMIRVSDIDASLKFFCDGLGMQEFRRVENEAGRFTLIFLVTPDDLARKPDQENDRIPSGTPMLELTYNWDEAGYDGGRNFGHLAYRVDDIYKRCQHLADMGYEINRPPRGGWMAFVKSPDNISVELLQKGDALAPQEPWASAENVGSW